MDTDLDPQNPVPSERANCESDRVVETLRREIVLGVIPAGTPLVERTLGARFGIASRLPVRDALRRLAAEALIDHPPRRRAMVRAFTGRDLANTSEVFEIVDALAIREAAVRRSPADLEVMQQHVHSGRRALSTHDAESQAHHAREFRSAIFTAARNTTLSEIKERIEARVWRMVEHKARHTDAGSFFDDLYSAISAQDPDTAESAFLRYMQQWRQVWKISAFNEIDAHLTTTRSAPVQTTPKRHVASKDPGFVPEFEKIATCLRDQILSGRRRPGDCLSERQIAQEFSVSRAPVVEAITLLVLEGLATRPMHRSAALVRGVPDSDVSDFFNVCATLDTAAIVLAAERATTAQIDHMRQIVDDEERAALAGDLRLVIEKGRVWREVLHQMTENDVLSDSVRLLHGRLQMLMDRVHDALKISRGHRLIFDAIESRQPAVAKAVVQRVFALDWHDEVTIPV
ncbi:GntR family transcriptional regulator [Arthrobacter woluwensis]|uniref:DNA-binding transcriptional regulator, GntR family n=1 Tax=Arthrobacter woluwensis TaxID=156980 RepID=A0A1H4SIV2_9MICC|nr:GntR family transcriptional regulator [Arthrobacter woluwensis]SEC44112.1 DNA-binding transcriptional regulator, GntR family [Arthrobacter woluwensis]